MIGQGGEASIQHNLPKVIGISGPREQPISDKYGPSLLMLKYEVLLAIRAHSQTNPNNISEQAPIFLPFTHL